MLGLLYFRLERFDYLAVLGLRGLRLTHAFLNIVDVHRHFNIVLDLSYCRQLKGDDADGAVSIHIADHLVSTAVLQLHGLCWQMARMSQSRRRLDVKYTQLPV